MVALGFDKNRPWLAFWFILIDHGEGCGMGPPDFFEYGAVIKRGFRRGQMVDLIAGGLAFPASDTPGNVMKNPYASGISREMSSAGCFRLSGKAFGSYLAGS